MQAVSSSLIREMGVCSRTRRRILLGFWLIDSRADAKLKDDSVALVIHRKNGLCKLEFNKGVKVSSPKFNKSFKLKGLLLFERFLEICNRKIYHGIKFRITRIKKRFLNKSLD